MKKFIKAATANGDINQYAAEQVESEVSEISHYGYNADVTLDGKNIIITISKHKESFMPTIEIVAVRQGNYLYLNPTLKFPTLTWTEDDYADSIAYYLKEWARLGSFMTSINNFVFDYSEWKYDSEDNEWYYNS